MRYAYAKASFANLANTTVGLAGALGGRKRCFQAELFAE
jgi:hypothetical protein